MNYSIFIVNIITFNVLFHISEFIQIYGLQYQS